jgi:hypothetical protein
MSFAIITLCVAFQRVFNDVVVVVVVYFIINSVWKLLDTPLYMWLSLIQKFSVAFILLVTSAYL